MKDARNFSEFWQHYVEAHAHPLNRALHVLATGLSVGYAMSYFLTGQFNVFIWLGLTYGPSWLGHALIERNKPATFSHPFWSLRADLLMVFKILTRQTADWNARRHNLV